MPTTQHFNKDIPPELQGVSVKELVKVIGESRANGNGVTPPGTPGSQRRAAAAAAGGGSSSHSGSPQLSRGSSPASVRSAAVPTALKGSPISRSPLSASNETDLNRQDSSQSDTSALVSSIARDLSQSPSCSHSHEMLASPSLSTQSEAVLGSHSRSPRATRRTASNQRQQQQQHLAENSESTSTAPDVAIMTRLASSTDDALSMSAGDAASASSVSKPNCAATATDSGRGEEQAKSSSSSGRTTGNTASNTPITVKETEMPEKPKDPSSSTPSILLQDFVFPKRPIKEAMSPSVAESIRSVFAAFVWHEGIVHDTMAVASYLKFHPSLSKEGSISGAPAAKTSDEKASPIAEGDENRPSKTKKQANRKQRHSVEVISTPYLKDKTKIVDPGKSSSSATAKAVPTNANLAVQLRKGGDSGSILQETGAAAAVAKQQMLLHQSLQQIRDSALPYTMRLLVMLWEEIRSYCMHAILQQMILASPLHLASSTSRRGDHRREKDKKGKKVKRKSSSSHGSLGRKESALGSAWPAAIPSAGEDSRGGVMAGLPHLSEKEAFYQLCDMCGHYFQHPVTYHMRLAHPGCGKAAGGKGYNSGGNYCGGWAGNCGDGGVGGSSWYLICEKCREEHKKSAIAIPSASKNPASREKQSSSGTTPDLDVVSRYVSGKISAAMASAFQSKQLTRRRPLSAMLPPSRITSPTGHMNSHLIMHNNAMFLLDLASASNSNLVPPAQLARQRSAPASFPFAVGGSSGGRMASAAFSGHHPLSAVSELAGLDPNPFPLVPFQCFKALGVRASRLKMLNEELILEEALKGEEPARERGAAAEQHQRGQSLTDPTQHVQTMVGEKCKGSVGMAEGSSPERQADATSTSTSSPSTKRPFCRSISVGAADGSKHKKPHSLSSEKSEGDRDASGTGAAGQATTPDDRTRKRNSSYVDGSVHFSEEAEPPSPSSSSASPSRHQDFLSKPSPALQKLFGSSSHMVMADILQRPVMGFVLQWNDLESLQLAMTVALRKAACRTFAMQALDWLLRSVSQVRNAVCST